MKKNNFVTKDTIYKEVSNYLKQHTDLNRAVIGYCINDTLEASIVIKSLQQVKEKRVILHKAIFHSDRGIQYACDDFKNQLKQYGMVQSMSAKGNSYDNAVAESFFHSLKTEYIYHFNFDTKKEATQEIKRYITFYNTKRLHSYNNYISPFQAEIRWWRDNIRNIQNVA